MQHKNDGYVKNFVKALKKIKYISKNMTFLSYFLLNNNFLHFKHFAF